MACATILVRRPFLLPENFVRMLVQKDRDLSFDAFRGLAIVAVVATHAIELCLVLMGATRKLLPEVFLQ